MNSRGNSGIYNGISFLFLLLTVLVIVVVAIRMMGDPIEEDTRPVAALPTAQQLPTVTPVPPSNTPRPTLPPTATQTPTNTPSPTETEPPTETFTPSPTITDTPGPSLTPSDTPTASVSPTPRPSDTPIGPTITHTPTDSPFLFALRNDVVFSQNSVNSAACAWQGIGGNVLDQNLLESNRQFQVRVFGNGIERVVTTGSNTLYGQLTGWEVAVGNTTSPGTYFARLETLQGTQISADIPVTFPGDCLSNSAFLSFVQVRDF